jgi:hypothetical protein
LDKFLGLLGGFICLASLFFVAAATGDLIGGDPDTSGGVLVGLLVFFSGTAFSGGYLARRYLFGVTPEPEDLEESQERQILRLAAERGGTLRVAEVVVHTDLSVTETKEAFDRLTCTDVVEMDSDDDGHILYRFPGLEDEHLVAPQVVEPQPALHEVEVDD